MAMPADVQFVIFFTAITGGDACSFLLSKRGHSLANGIGAG